MINFFKNESGGHTLNVTIADHTYGVDAMEMSNPEVAVNAINVLIDAIMKKQFGFTKHDLIMSVYNGLD